MKNWMLIALSATLAMACSEKGERLDKDDLRRRIALQRAEYEKTKNKEVEYDSKDVDFTSSKGDFEVARNSSGDILIVGDQSILLNYDEQGNYDVANIGSDVAGSINDNGEWIAVGDKAVIVKLEGEPAFEYKSLNLGKAGSKFDAHINNNGDWIAGGNNGVYINGVKLQNIRISKSTDVIKVHIDDNRSWGVTINNDVKTGVFIPDSSENSNDDSSRQ